jgi:hypothetical protein
VNGAGGGGGLSLTEEAAGAVAVATEAPDEGADAAGRAAPGGTVAPEEAGEAGGDGVSLERSGCRAFMMVDMASEGPLDADAFEGATAAPALGGSTVKRFWQ